MADDSGGARLRVVHARPLRLGAVVEKTPGNERAVDHLFGAFPDAIVIHVVRDPVAVFASRKVLESAHAGRLPLTASRGISHDLSKSPRR